MPIKIRIVGNFVELWLSAIPEDRDFVELGGQFLYRLNRGDAQELGIALASLPMPCTNRLACIEEGKPKSRKWYDLPVAAAMWKGDGSDVER